MKFGIDYWGTISQAPDVYRALAGALMDAGHEVHVITAVGHVREHTVLHDIEMLKFPCTTVRMLVFDHASEAPSLKVAYCKEFGIRMLIDDRSDICQAAHESGIVALNAFRTREPRRR